MKKIKTVMSLILMLSLTILLLAEPAFAASLSENNEPVELSEEEVAALDLSEFNLVDSATITAFLDENGEVADVTEGDVPSLYSSTPATGDHYSIVIDFYKSGSTYYVQMTATAKPDRWWVEKVKLSILPLNKTDWMVREDTPGDQQNTYVMPALFWTYPNGSPANVTVDVKFYIHTAGKYTLEDSFTWSLTRTLENP